jgi:glyoxylate reductase
VPAPRVFVARRIPKAGLDLLLSAAEVEVWPGDMPPPPSILREKARDAEGLLTLLTDVVDAELLASAPNLKVVSDFAVGVNNVDLAAATKHGVKVGNTPGVLTDATADCAVALLLAAARRIVEGDRYSRAGLWKTWEPVGHIGQDLVGRTLGIVGMGRIGFAVAKRLRFGWNMNVVYMNRSDNDWTRQAESELGARRTSFETLLAESDFVSVHASLNADSKHLFDAAAFQRMKPTAVFVNTARGGVVVENDLCEALEKGWIFAAGLDVTDPEPPAPHSRLFQLENVVVAPHLASATVLTRNRMAELAAENLIAGLLDRRMPSCVNEQDLARRSRER